MGKIEAKVEMKKYRPAVFVLAYTLENTKPEYILLKRKLHWKGWEFAKGKIELGETKVQTAKRELLEETGLRAIKIRKFPYNGKYNYRKILPDRPKYKGQTFSLFGAEVKKDRVSLDPKEHNGHKWVNFTNAHKMLTWGDQKKSLRIVNSWLKKRK